MFRLTHCVLVLSVDVSLGATGGEEEDVVAFVGGDSREDEGMRLCTGGEEVGDPLDVIQVQDPGSVTPTTRLPLSGDDTVFLVPPDGVGAASSPSPLDLFQVDSMGLLSVMVLYTPRSSMSFSRAESWNIC